MRSSKAEPRQRLRTGRRKRPGRARRPQLRVEQIGELGEEALHAFFGVFGASAVTARSSDRGGAASALLAFPADTLPVLVEAALGYHEIDGVTVLVSRVESAGTEELRPASRILPGLRKGRNADDELGAFPEAPRVQEYGGDIVDSGSLENHAGGKEERPKRERSRSSSSSRP